MTSCISWRVDDICEWPPHADACALAVAGALFSMKPHLIAIFAVLATYTMNVIFRACILVIVIIESLKPTIDGHH